MLAALPQLGLQQLVDMDFTVFRQFFEYLFLHINSHWCLFRVIIRFSIPGLSTFVRVFYKCAVSSNKKYLFHKSHAIFTLHLQRRIWKKKFGPAFHAMTSWNYSTSDRLSFLLHWAALSRDGLHSLSFDYRGLCCGPGGSHVSLSDRGTNTPRTLGFKHEKGKDHLWTLSRNTAGLMLWSVGCVGRVFI